MTNLVNKVATKATFSQVADTNSNTTILAANGSRIGATFTNTSSARLYLRFDGGTNTTANHSVSLAQNASYELPFAFNGTITGIWATDPGDGGANVTEYTG